MRVYAGKLYILSHSDTVEIADYIFILLKVILDFIFECIMYLTKTCFQTVTCFPFHKMAILTLTDT